MAFRRIKTETHESRQVNQRIFGPVWCAFFMSIFQSFRACVVCIFQSFSPATFTGGSNEKVHFNIHWFRIKEIIFKRTKERKKEEGKSGMTYLESALVLIARISHVQTLALCA